MATIHIDNQPYEVDTGNNLLQTCLSLGFDLPYFCWHPALGSVGACRQCAVKVFKDENDTLGRIYMACMTPVKDNMRISLEDSQIKEFHAQIIEWLMTNHPHDCPVCDEGGECHLQDMTVLSGHNYRRFRFPKRTFRNQNLGPFINHEMNRCITCYRCVRFYNDYAGGTDLQPMASKNHVYFGRHEDGPLENEFSGNLVEVCPTGVFTDKTLKQHYARKWDMQSAPSVCVHCGLGCNTLPSERYGSLRRIQNRYHGEINGYFLCDRGRFGYAFVNSEKRIRQPMWRDGDGLNAVSKTVALHQLATTLHGRRVVGIGSPRASLESNYLLRRLVGAENFYAGVAVEEWKSIQTIHRILDGPAHTPSLHDVEQADAVFILGEDVTSSAPRLALSLRQAARQAAFRHAESLDIPLWQDRSVRSATQGIFTPFFIATVAPTRLDELAQTTYRGAPDDIARLGFTVAHCLDDQAPAVADLSTEILQTAEHIARHLSAAQRPLIVSGTGCGSEAVVEAAANIARALCKRNKPASLSYAVPECNSLGLAMLEPRLFEHPERIQADTLVILENDIYRRATDDQVETLFSNVENVVVIDHLQTPTADHAKLLLPAATFAESSGTLINNEGRAQRFFQVFQAEQTEVQSSRVWLAECLNVAPSLDQVLQQLSADFPQLAAVADAAPDAEFRLLGQRIPRQSARYSGRTAIHAAQTMHEPQPVVDVDSALAYSMEGYGGEPPPPLITRAWAPHWNSLQAFNKLQQEVGGPLRGGDPGVRLIEASEKSAAPYFNRIPSSFEARSGQWLVVPRQHLFGSEELSLHTPQLRDRVPAPYLGISQDDAAILGVKTGDVMELRFEQGRLRLPFELIPALPKGVLALPQLPGIEPLDGPRWAELRRISS